MQAVLLTSVLGVRLVLAAVFVIASVAKTAGRRALPATLGAFGIPAGAARPLAAVLPAAELVVAAALVPAASARDGALAAIGIATGTPRRTPSAASQAAPPRRAWACRVATGVNNPARLARRP